MIKYLLIQSRIGYLQEAKILMNFGLASYKKLMQSYTKGIKI